MHENLNNKTKINWCLGKFLATYTKTYDILSLLALFYSRFVYYLYKCFRSCFSYCIWCAEKLSEIQIKLSNISFSTLCETTVLYLADGTSFSFLCLIWSKNILISCLLALCKTNERHFMMRLIFFFTVASVVHACVTSHKIYLNI